MKLVSIGSLKTLHLFEVTPTEKCLTQRNSFFFFSNDEWWMDALFKKPERQSRSCKEKGLISKLNCYQKANLTQVDVQFKSVLGTLQNWHCTSNTFHTLTPIFFIDTRAMTLELWSGKSFRKCGRPLNLWMCACFSQPRACGWITFVDLIFL